MIELDPGHRYKVESYPAKENDASTSTPFTIQFRKRIGEGYPGNTGHPLNGTSTQELLRVIIKRSIYVNNQDPHKANEYIVECCRQSIYELEERAALRRGNDYYNKWSNIYFNDATSIEDVLPCKICGHIFCLIHSNYEVTQVGNATEPFILTRKEWKK